MEHLNGGKLNKEIAETMEISLHTVKNHLKSIYKKMSVRNRVEAIIKYNNSNGTFKKMRV